MADNATTAPVRILHLEDSEIDHQLVALTLRKHGLAFDMERVETLEDFGQRLDESRFDVILADYHLAGFTALDAWALLRGRAQRPPFVLLSGAIGEAAAVEAIRIGLSDYVLKDHIGKLPHVLERAIEVWQARQDQARADAELAASERRLAALTEHLQTSIEQERAAIAREVHDDIGGSLAAIRLDLAWIARHSQQDAAMQAHATAASEMLQHALEASQRIMMNLRPPILDQGLVAAIGWLAEAFERRTGVTTTLAAPLAGIDIDKTLALAAYRTAQEALTNAAKYAECSRVVIDLSDGEGVLTLEVSDNGRGFAADARDKPRSFGLRGLAERARTVGGWLDVSSRPGAGTTIILSIPLHAEAAARLAQGESA